MKMLRRRFTLGLLGVATLLLAGVGVSAGVQWGAHQTNTVEFCTSCHEMREHNYAEYKDTIHARNHAGVKAVCSDCHVPHDPVGLTLRKIGAAKDVWAHFTGEIDTPEKFDAHRLEMATQVWRHMKKTDSAECRHCHDVTAMDREAQGPTARKQHEKIGKNGKTCIDCHYGIAHKEPAGGVEPADVVDGS